MATSIQTFAGNVGIGTNDPKAYALNIADGGTTRMVSLSATSIQVGTITNSFIPAGSIALWSGSVATIPDGWTLCDGTDGTPNLTDRFIVGAGTTYAVDDTGGTSSTTLSSSNLPLHTHSGGNTGNQSANHGHYVTDPGHYHREKASDNDGQREGTTSQSRNGYAQAGFNSANANHNITLGNNDANHGHTFTTAAYGSGTPSSINILPSYYALAYIMKT